MSILTADVLDVMQRAILSFVATVSQEGSPNLSPKAPLVARNVRKLLMRIRRSLPIEARRQAMHLIGLLKNLPWRSYCGPKVRLGEAVLVMIRMSIFLRRNGLVTRIGSAYSEGS